MIGCVLSISCFSWDKWECPRKNVFLYCLPLWAETKQLQPVAEMRSLERQEPRGNVWRYLRSSQLGEWRRSWHLLVRDWRYCLTILHQAWEITDQILLRVKENRNKSGQNISNKMKSERELEFQMPQSTTFLLPFRAVHSLWSQQFWLTITAVSNKWL